MLINWGEFIGGLLSCDSKTDAKKKFDHLLQDLGISKILYLDTQSTSIEQADQSNFLDNFPEEWMQHYIDKNYLADDPIIEHCLNSANSSSWQNDVDWNVLSPLARQMGNERIEHGLAQGFTFPLHHVTNTALAALSLSTESNDPEFDKFITEHNDTFHLAGILFHSTLQTFSSHETAVELSNRQREVLYWVFVHKRTKQIADILNISERTVNLHIGAATKKLNAKSRYEAAAMAVKLNLIHP